MNKSNVSNILKLKENYSTLSLQKIKTIHKMITNTDKVKLYIRITTKGSFRKQIIISMSKTNTDNIMVFLANHINRALKNIKSKVIVVMIDTSRIQHRLGLRVMMT